MARPPVLYPLFADLTGLPGIGPKGAALFARLGIERPRDLLFHLPTGVIDRRLRESLAGVEPGQTVTLRARIGEHRPGRSRTAPYRVLIETGETLLEVVHFRAQSDWMAKLYPPGAVRLVSGRIEMYEGRWQMPHPDLVLSEAEAADLPAFEPVYPATQGLSQRQIAKAAHEALARLPEMGEWLPADLLAERGWPAFGPALSAAHAPEGPPGLGDPARCRLAFDELLSHQLALALARARMRRGRGRASRGDGRLRQRAARAFGHPPTGAQTRALDEILADMADETRMLRLLQGDVGAGKTWVALMALLAAVEAGGQGALMAPTEILARQHGASLASLAAAADVRLEVLTGRDKGEARRRIAGGLAEGTVQIAVGTHALLSEDVAFRDLRLVVIDEQHRFGVRQRMELTEKAPAGADVLVMTATPIPRTLALAGYGDLDISVLDEKPPGRQPVETRLASIERYEEVVAHLARAIEGGARAFWVCPLVEETAELPMVAAEARHKALAERLGEARVALVHGQMTAEGKDRAMAAFQSGAAQVLVATTVIEVGVDVPEATIMVIEEAESFGLAQLHQLRGRVGRGVGRSSCLLLFRPPLGEAARARLEILRESEDGFRIAEEDLRLRGAGDLLGLAQSGLPRFRIADLEGQTELMERARAEARRVLATDPDLASVRGAALRLLLYLMDRDAAVRLMKTG
ncbi:MAG: ATP-dependent DNA helicase RecG [Paracoccaceae bacterium]